MLLDFLFYYDYSEDLGEFKAWALFLNAADAILGLKPTLYRVKTDADDVEKQLGFLAQDVKEFIPQAYVESNIGDEVFIGLSQMPFIAALVKGMQEQNQIIQELNERLNKAGL